MSQSEDMDSINAYIQGAALVSSAAMRLKTDWANWWTGLSWYDKNLDSNTFNIARNKRNDFSLANVKTIAEKQKVQQVLNTGLTAEQQLGAPDPRDASGKFPVIAPPLIPVKYQTLALGTGIAGILLFAYAFGKSAPGAVLNKGTTIKSGIGAHLKEMRSDLHDRFARKAGRLYG